MSQAELCPNCQQPGLLGPWRPLDGRADRVSAIITGNTHERSCTGCGARERASFEVQA